MYQVNISYLRIHLVIKRRSHYLLREPSKKRMKKEELKESLLIHRDLEKDNQELIVEITDLKDLLNEYKMRTIEAEKNNEILEDLYNKGIIDKSGNEVIKF